MTLEVVEPGWMTTVQDGGRPDQARLGVPVGGAADAWSFRVANALLGNALDAAVLEVTIGGLRVRMTEPLVLALAGADLRATTSSASRPAQRVRPGRTILLGRGDELALPGPPVPGTGARAYLAVGGGWDVPVVLGSRSTCLAAGFGGIHGRALSRGDRLEARRPAVTVAQVSSVWPGEPAGPRRHDGDDLLVRVLPGVGRHSLGGKDPLAALTQRAWTVAPDSNRMGLRLTSVGSGLRADTTAAEALTHGVVQGSVQLPPDGRPIVLLADHQPTGGYPVVAVAITADLPALGQAAPGDRIRFVPVTTDEARRALETDRRAWTDAARQLGLAGLPGEEA